MAPHNVFAAALRDMSTTGDAIYGPTSFRDYLRRQNIDRSDTANFISVDSLESLHPSLRISNTMVLRLGSAPVGTGTQFALVKTNLLDFFIADTEAFTQKISTTYLPTASMRDLFPYQVLPIFSESSYVSIALASGLLTYALSLDPTKATPYSATGASTYTFPIRLHSSLPSVYQHNNGQVEIDSLFLGHRQGRDLLFVVEAKADKQRTLAKHKLVYSVLAIAQRVPVDIAIIPVYMRVAQYNDGFHYHIVECTLPDPRTCVLAIDDLKPIKHMHVTLPRLAMP